MENLSTSHFRNILKKNIKHLKSLCKEWNEESEDLSVPEEVRGEIRVTIGLTNLLLSEKCKQFEGLIEDCELKRGENEITCLDLQGFWDMIYKEVEKIETSFDKLEKCKSNNWVFVQEETKKVPNVKRTIPAIAKSSIATKKLASAAQQRLAEAKQKMKERLAQQQQSNEISHQINEMVTNDKDKQTALSEKSNEVEGKKSLKKKTRNVLDKENILPQSVTEPKNKLVSNTYKGRGKAKEVIPLQCVTRAAKRAMLAKQKEMQEN